MLPSKRESIDACRSPPSAWFQQQVRRKRRLENRVPGHWHLSQLSANCFNGACDGCSLFACAQDELERLQWFLKPGCLSLEKTTQPPEGSNLYRQRPKSNSDNTAPSASIRVDSDLVWTARLRDLKQALELSLGSAEYRLEPSHVSTDQCCWRRPPKAPAIIALFRGIWAAILSTADPYRKVRPGPLRSRVRRGGDRANSLLDCSHSRAQRPCRP